MSKESEIHLPAPSYWPILLAGGLVLIAIGVISSFAISIVGIIVLLISIAGWTMENRSQEKAHHE